MATKAARKPKASRPPEWPDNFPSPQQIKVRAIRDLITVLLDSHIGTEADPVLDRLYGHTKEIAEQLKIPQLAVILLLSPHIAGNVNFDALRELHLWMDGGEVGREDIVGEG